jgi:NAD(P)-dependent dehydrogenase (short-subunit alcohol dehydrogenase family)
VNRGTAVSELSGRTTVIVGASRGLGRGIARAFAEADAPVVAVARTGAALAELATTSVNIHTEVADATDASVAWSLLDDYEPEVLILVAGANPVMRPLQDLTWETFSVNWHTDVKIAFTWVREALLKPLPPGSRVVVVAAALPLTDHPPAEVTPGRRPPSGSSRHTHRMNRAAPGWTSPSRPCCPG